MPTEPQSDKPIHKTPPPPGYPAQRDQTEKPQEQKPDQKKKDQPQQQT